MKKISIILGLAAVAFGFSSCKQEDEPKYQAPGDDTTFIISTPALQNVEFETGSEMTDASTFNLFCSQPDYGYAAVCSYSVIVSTEEDCPVEKVIDEETGAVSIQPVEGKSVALENQNPTSAAMTFKTFDLGIALMNLNGIYNDKEAYDASDLSKLPVKAYFRAVCEIKGIDNSAIASANVVSLNSVKVNYGEKKAGWIYICGNVQNPETGEIDNFTGPNESNYGLYYNNFRLEEPADMLGMKIYVGKFNLVPEKADIDFTNVDDTANFRFFTQLLGWSDAASLGSDKEDFFKLPIQDQFATGYKGQIVDHGLGNWGVWVTEPTPMTVVVDVTDLKIYIIEGFREVTFLGREPQFN